jgi:hypothetical protein
VQTKQEESEMSSKGENAKAKSEKVKPGDKKDKIRERKDSFKIELTKIGYLEENTSGKVDYVCTVD